jgi:hypothetical protein
MDFRNGEWAILFGTNFYFSFKIFPVINNLESYDWAKEIILNPSESKNEEFRKMAFRIFILFILYCGSIFR